VIPKPDGTCPSCQYDFSHNKPAKRAVQIEDMATTKEENNTGFRKRVSILGFIVGSITDIVGTNIWALFMMIYVMVSHNLLQTAASSPTELSTNVLNIFQTDHLVFSVNFIVGAMFSVLGGYIGAYIAKHDELLNGALSSFLCVLSGIYWLFTGPHPIYLILLEIFGLIISPLLGMLGGYLRLKQKPRRQTLIPA
jgi:hypothetical protein